MTASKEAKMKKVSESKKDLIQLELRQSRFNVSRAVNLLNKTIVLYVIFLIIAVIGSVQGYINQRTVSLLVIMGIVLLLVGVIPYFRIMAQEDKRLSELIYAIKGS